MDTTKRRALGKGLEELFNNEKLDFNTMEEKIVNSTPKSYWLLLTNLSKNSW